MCIENIHGNMPYQKRAREILPVLVRQAKTGQHITYSGLAEEVGTGYRSLGKPLGSISKTLKELNENRSNQNQIPEIQCIVVRKDTLLPGEGVGWYLSGKPYSELTKDGKQTVINKKQAKVYNYNYWDKVLKKLGLD